jgi:hypothetical protein
MPFRLAVFRRRLDEQFTATAKIERASSIPDRPPVRISGVSVGISFEPLRRLSPLLDHFDDDILSESVWPPIAKTGNNSSRPALDIGNEEEVERAADTVSAVIFERAVLFAERHASLDSLLATFSGRRGGYSAMTHAALLATAGRYEEAREQLARRDRSEPSLVDRSTRRAVWQLGRWIDSGGDPALIPSSPPPNPLAYSLNRPSFSEARAATRAQNAALDEVKETARGRPPEQARLMLCDALARHGAPEPAPLWIENQLEHLWDTREDRIVSGFQAIRHVAGLGRGIVKAIRDHDIPDFSLPGWLEPPANALYEIPRSDLWTRVELDPEAIAYLDRVYEACPHIFGLANPSAWLDTPDQTLGSMGPLEVALGERRVGTVPTAAAPAYTEVVSAAAAREEHVCVNARLSVHAGAYLLELEKPRAEA